MISIIPEFDGAKDNPHKQAIIRNKETKTSNTQQERERPYRHFMRLKVDMGHIHEYKHETAT